MGTPLGTPIRTPRATLSKLVTHKKMKLPVEYPLFWLKTFTRKEDIIAHEICVSGKYWEVMIPLTLVLRLTVVLEGQHSLEHQNEQAK